MEYENGVSVQDMEEAEYFWCLSDMSKFVAKYGIDEVIKDLEAFLSIQSQRVYE